MANLPELAERDPFATKVILMVEDDPDLSKMLKGMLEIFVSYQVIHAADASQALNIVQSVQPDLFLFDYRLPDIDGLELYQKLHDSKEFATIPVLFLSAHAPKDLLEKRHLPYMSKPFEIDALLQKVDRLLSR
ncbi:MAG TPA: response regulator [Ktedonobacteraceae bacterium]